MASSDAAAFAAKLPDASEGSSAPAASSAPPSHDQELSDLQLAEATSKFFDEQASARPLVGELEDIEKLKAEYAHSEAPPTYIKKSVWLQRRGWNGVRRLRGDGSCGYRALAFAFIEQLIGKPAAVFELARQALIAKRPLLEASGYDKTIIEEFEEPITNLLAIGPELTSQKVYEEFNDAMTSNYLVTYLRLLTAAHLRANQDDFLPFLWALPGADTFMLSEDPIREFCAAQVEPVSVEMDHIQLVALTQALGFAISAAYFDQHPVVDGGGASSGDDVASDESKVVFHQFRDESGRDLVVVDGTDKVALLFRIGHYDLIYHSK